MEKKQLYTIKILSENKPGVLYRIAGILLRRKINVDSLTVTETEKRGMSLFSITIHTSETIIHTLAKQFDRIIEVLDVEVRKE